MIEELIPVVIHREGEAPVPVAVGGGQGNPGATGAPGGNVMAVGLFNTLAGTAVAAGTNQVMSSGYSAHGRGAALYHYDPAVNAAWVTANPRAGFLAADGRGFRLSGNVLHASMLGAVGDGVADDTPAAAAANAILPPGGTFVFDRGLTFKLTTSLTFTVADLTIDAEGATLVGSATGFDWTIRFNAARIKMRGGVLQSTVNHQDPWFLEVSQPDCKLFDVHFEKSDANMSGKYFCYVRAGAPGFEMRGGGARNYGGIFFETDRFAMLFTRLVNCIDDAIAIKGITAFRRDIRIIGNYIENAAGMVSIGSEVGVEAANDATYSKGVGNAVIIGNTGKNCSAILLCKPGSVAVDYRDGTVEGLVVSDNTLEDMTGTKMVAGFQFWVSRGARIRNVYGRNNVVTGRCLNTGARRAACVDFFFQDLGADGTAEPEISDIDLQIKFKDPYGGQTNNASRPGQPFLNAVTAEKAVAGWGNASNIKLDIEADGIANHAVEIGADFDDAFTFTRLKIKNGSVGASTFGGCYANSRIYVEEAEIDVAAGNPYVLGAAGEIVSRTENLFWIDQVNAGNNNEQVIWAAPKRCFVSRIDIIVSQAIAQSDVDYSTINFYNAGTLYHNPNTRATGGTAAVPNLNLAAHAVVQALLARTITDAGNLAQCNFARDATLRIGKVDTGAGRTFLNARMRIHWVPR
jgi:hypothetical protein